jgi:hypothetical protein
VDIMQEPCDANLLGHWKLDGHRRQQLLFLGCRARW